MENPLTAKRVEICPGFEFEIRSRARGLEMLKRRLGQAWQALRRSDWLDDHKIHREMQSRYSSEGELAFYRPFVRAGLMPFENEMWRRLDVNESQEILVVGCGTGREPLAMSESGARVLGLDICPKMANLGRDLCREMQKPGTRLDLRCGDERSVEGESFDVIWVAYSITGHIRGRKNRVEFYRRLLSALKPGGSIVTAPEIAKYSIRDPRRWLQIWLRLRFPFRSETGDSLRSFLGNHNPTDELIYFHVYPDTQNFIDEVHEAGGQFVDDFERLIWRVQRQAERTVDFKSEQLASANSVSGPPTA